MPLSKDSPLRAVLTEDELRQYRAEGLVTITGSDGHRYQVNMGAGVSGNVYQLNAQGDRWTSICCHQMSHEYNSMTRLDVFASQIIWIKTNAQRFLAIGCASRQPLAAKEGAKARVR